MLSFNTSVPLLILLIQYVLSFNIDSQNNIAVYWGQNSGGNQKRLSEYCQSSNANIFVLSFLDIFPDSIGLNFANACSDTFSDDSSLLHCTEIASDIETCQSLDKKVLLSLGGASGSYGFTTDEEAETFAQTLWNTFGEGSNSTSVDRPFDSVLIDGFDFDIENNNPLGYSALVNKLRELFKHGSKQYYISAAPQCPYPDASVGELLTNSEVDFAFIQFYNNYCNVGRQFNWAEWENYATNVSPNSNIKLFLGLPGSPTAAGSGFISDLTLLKETIDSIKENENFGGVSIWDASQGFSYEIDGTNYIENIEALLNDNSSTSSSTSSSSSSSTSSKVTSTSLSSLVMSSTTTVISLSSSTKVTSTLAPTTSIVSTTTTSSSSISSSSSSYNKETTTLSPTSISISMPRSTTSTMSTASITSTATSTNTNSDNTASQSIVVPPSTEQVSSTLTVSNGSTSTSVSTPPPVSIASFQPGNIFTDTDSIIIPSSAATFVGTFDKTTSTLTPNTPTAVATTTLDDSSSTKTSSIKHITSTLYPVSTSSTTSTTSTNTISTVVSTTASTTVSTSATSTSSNTAHEQARKLNELYAKGKYNGESTCIDGELACSSDGKFAICNFGSWTTMECASGTTCYAYDQGGQIFTQCGFSDLKQNFI